MEIASIFIGMLLIGSSVVVVSRPFWEKKPRAHKVRAQGVIQPADSREAVLSAMRDLDFDFKTGKVCEEDYAPLREKLLAQAAQFTQQLEASEEQLEALIRSRKIQKSARCGECGAPAEAGQQFCSKCGSPVVQSPVCPSCGNKVKPRDLFCTSCGSQLEPQTKAMAQT